jgi:hypothetical protein
MQASSSTASGGIGPMAAAADDLVAPEIDEALAAASVEPPARSTSQGIGLLGLIALAPPMESAPSCDAGEIASFVVIGGIAIVALPALISFVAKRVRARSDASRAAAIETFREQHPLRLDISQLRGEEAAFALLFLARAPQQTLQFMLDAHVEEHPRLSDELFHVFQALAEGFVALRPRKGEDLYPGAQLAALLMQPSLRDDQRFTPVLATLAQLKSWAALVGTTQERRSTAVQLRRRSALR